MQDNIPKRIFISTLYNYIGSVSIAIISFFTLIYLTRNLSVAQFGQYNLILSTQVFFTLLLSLGLPSIILRFIPEYVVKKDFGIVRKIIWYSISLVLLFGIVISILAAILSKNFPDTINKFFIAEYLLLSSVLGLLRVEVRICEASFFAFLKQGYKISFEVLGTIVKLYLFILAIKLNFGLLGIILSIGAVDIFLTISYLLRIETYMKAKTVLSTEMETKRFFKYGIKVYLSKFFAFFWDTRIDAYIITFYLGTVLTGIFYFVINIVTVLTEYMPGTIMYPISQAIFARQYAKYKNQKELIYLFKLNNKLKAFFVFPIFIGFLSVIDKIVILFFPKYTDSIQLFPIILFFMLFYIFLMPITNIISTLEKNEISLLGNIAILYKIPMTIFLTKNFGLIGTAFALGSSIFIFFIIQLFLIKRLIKICYPWFAFFKILINSLIAIFVALAFRPLIKNIFSLCIFILISGLVYLVVSFLNKAFDDYDRQIINKPFNKLIWIF